jgi:hypothetical protein
MTNQNHRFETLYPYVIFLLCFAWFAHHAVPSLYFGDGGELLASIRVGGIPHPTGFPLLLLLGTLPSQAGAFAANLVSAAAGALAIILTALWTDRLFGRVVSFSSVCILLGSSTLLLQSSVTRVYPYQLATLIAVVLVITLFKPNPRWGLFFGFFLGLSATTHTLFLAGLLYALVTLWDRRKGCLPLLPWISAGLLLGLSLYLWLPLRAHLVPAMAWANPDGFTRFLDYLTQKEYALKMAARGPMETWLFVQALARVFWMEWNPLVWILALEGGWLIYQSARRTFWGIASIVAFNILLLYLYGSNVDLDILYRYFLPTYACVAVMASVAVRELWCRYIENRAPKFIHRVLSGVLLLTMFLPIPAFRWSDLSHSTLCRTYNNALLRPLPTIGGMARHGLSGGRPNHEDNLSQTHVPTTRSAMVSTGWRLPLRHGTP